MLREVRSFSKQSSKIIAVEQKSTRLANLSRKSSENMCSNALLDGQIFAMVNIFG